MNFILFLLLFLSVLLSGGSILYLLNFVISHANSKTSFERVSKQNKPFLIPKILPNIQLEEPIIEISINNPAHPLYEMRAARLKELIHYKNPKENDSTLEPNNFVLDSVNEIIESESGEGGGKIIIEAPSPQNFEVSKRSKRKRKQMVYRCTLKT